MDLHTHLMPAVDDGAREPEESAAAMERLVGAGAALAVATPHLPVSGIRPEAAGRRMDALDEAWERLVATRDERCPGLRLERGVELRLDAPEPDLSDPRLRLGGGPSVLVEFDRFRISPGGESRLEEISGSGWQPVLAHPERYAGIGDRMEDAVPSWRDAGAAVLVNAGSLLGRHGTRAREAATELLRRGWTDALASDYHARGEPGWSPVVEALREAGGGEQLELLTVTNPRRILEGERPLPVPPLDRRSSLGDRIRRWLG